MTTNKGTIEECNDDRYSHNSMEQLNNAEVPHSHMMGPRNNKNNSNVLFVFFCRCRCGVWGLGVDMDGGMFVVPSGICGVNILICNYNLSWWYHYDNIQWLCSLTSCNDRRTHIIIIIIIKSSLFEMCQIDRFAQIRRTHAMNGLKDMLSSFRGTHREKMQHLHNQCRRRRGRKMIFNI